MFNDEEAVLEWSSTGMHNLRAGSGPQACFIRPSEQAKNTRNF